ncbi:ribonuclease [Sphingomonas sp. ID0503]|uniref:ribonuclease n=1 Tax=Sphingomonas sp. ID0503 TaxID=3399691 RepID=UPI003AFA9D96
MAEWLYEEGIGERRAALVDKGAIVEALIERDGAGARLGAILPARLGRAMVDTGRAAATLDTGEPVILRQRPPGVSEGAAIRVEILREAIPDAGDPKPAQGRATDAYTTPAPTLRQRLTGHPVRELLPHQPDELEAAGWSELIEEARSGLVAFSAGLLRIALTPAMTVIDVDGSIRNVALALAGAEASTRAIRRLGIAGSIGIDLPTLQSKADRQAAAGVIDAILPQPFERTAVNGFGFIQIVRPRFRPSLPELIRATPIETAALALLRRASRLRAGSCALHAAPAVMDWLAARPHLTDALARANGGAVALRPDPALAISAGHAVRL